MGAGQSGASFDYDAHLLADSKPQALPVAASEDKTSTPAYRSAAYPELQATPFASESSAITTIWEAFQRGLSKSTHTRCLGTRAYEGVDDNKHYLVGADGVTRRGPYVWETYQQVNDQAVRFGAGLRTIGCNAHDNIGIWAINRAEWIISALGLYSQNMRVVSLYATLGDEAVLHIINHAEIAVIITEKENTRKLIGLIPKLTHLRYIIQYDHREVYNTAAEYVDDKDIKDAAEHKVKLIGYSDIINAGDAALATFPLALPKPEDLAFVMYTSGTTGIPKGALLRHSNVVAAVAAVPVVIVPTSDDIHISYLPLAHVFETIIQVSVYAHGAAVGFFWGNVKKLTNDFTDLKPTILCGVPRVFSKIHQRVFAGVADKNCMVKWYFKKAYDAQAKNLRLGKKRNAKYDAKVFIPLRSRMGLQNLKLVVTGAAPCPPYLLEFLRVVTGAVCCQGYGTTETAAAASITFPSDRTLGSVGAPMPCNEIKLVDIPEMAYLHTDTPHPRGEIWLRGANVFAGYHKDATGTADAIAPGGWLRTGDVGRLNPNGSFSIIDRKKNIFKLSHGEYIAVEKIEQEYSRAAIVGQIWVYGNSYKSSLLAVVVPAAEELSKYCSQYGWWPTDKADIKIGNDRFIQDYHSVLTGEHSEELHRYILNTLREHERALKGFEKVAQIMIETKIDNIGAGFNEKNQCLTPSFKLKRPQLLARYMTQLKALYTKLGEPDREDEKWPGEVATGDSRSSTTS